GAVDPAEAARGDLVQDAVAAQEVAVAVALEELGAVQWRQVALALQKPEERLGVAGLAQLVPRLLDLPLGHQPQPDRLLRQRARVKVRHGCSVPPRRALPTWTRPGPQRYHFNALARLHKKRLTAQPAQNDEFLMNNPPRSHAERGNEK